MEYLMMMMMMIVPVKPLGTTPTKNSGPNSRCRKQPINTVWIELLHKFKVPNMSSSTTTINWDCYSDQQPENLKF